ncbi:hypothetical protein P9112_009057 [Eukaryota sp. TZLM1-RC]
MVVQRLTSDLIPDAVLFYNSLNATPLTENDAFLLVSTSVLSLVTIGDYSNISAVIFLDSSSLNTLSITHYAWETQDSLIFMLQQAFSTLPFVTSISSPIGTVQRDVCLFNNNLALRNVYLEEFDDLCDSFPPNLLPSTDDLVDFLVKGEEESDYYCKVVELNGEYQGIISGFVVNEALTLSREDHSTVNWRDVYGRETRIGKLCLFSIKTYEIFTEVRRLVADFMKELKIDVAVIENVSNQSNCQSNLTIFDHPVAEFCWKSSNSLYFIDRLTVVDQSFILSDDHVIHDSEGLISIKFQRLSCNQVTDYGKLYHFGNLFGLNNSLDNLNVLSIFGQISAVSIEQVNIPTLMTSFSHIFLAIMTLTQSSLLVSQTSNLPLMTCEVAKISATSQQSIQLPSAPCKFFSKFQLVRPLTKVPFHIVIIGLSSWSLEVVKNLIINKNFQYKITIIDPDEHLSTSSKYWPVNADFNVDSLFKNYGFDIFSIEKGFVQDIIKESKKITIVGHNSVEKVINYDFLIVSPVLLTSEDSNSRVFSPVSATSLDNSLSVINQGLIGGQNLSFLIIVDDVYSLNQDFPECSHQLAAIGSIFGIIDLINQNDSLLDLKLLIATGNSHKTNDSILIKSFNYLVSLLSTFTGIEVIYADKVVDLTENSVEYLGTSESNQLNFDFCYFFSLFLPSFDINNYLASNLDLISDVSNDTLLVDQHLLTNDRFIFSIGPLTNLSRRSHLNLGQLLDLNQICLVSIGRYIADLIPSMYNLSCTQPQVSLSMVKELPLLNCVLSPLHLPNEPFKSTFIVRILDNSFSSKSFLVSSLFNNQKFNQNDIEPEPFFAESANNDSFSCFGFENSILTGIALRSDNLCASKLLEFSKLLAVDSNTLNHLIERFKQNLITDLFDFVNQSWAQLLYEDAFTILREALIQESNYSIEGLIAKYLPLILNQNSELTDHYLV